MCKWAWPRAPQREILFIVGSELFRAAGAGSPSGVSGSPKLDLCRCLLGGPREGAGGLLVRQHRLADLPGILAAEPIEQPLPRILHLFWYLGQESKDRRIAGREGSHSNSIVQNTGAVSSSLPGCRTAGLPDASRLRRGGFLRCFLQENRMDASKDGVARGAAVGLPSALHSSSSCRARVRTTPSAPEGRSICRAAPDLASFQSAMVRVPAFRSGTACQCRRARKPAAWTPK